MAFTFKIEHIALQPFGLGNTAKARRLLEKLGLTEWANDTMVTRGTSSSRQAITELDFNYQTTPDRKYDNGEIRPLEIEIMQAHAGENWPNHISNSVVSHFGMQVTWEQMIDVTQIFHFEDIQIAQHSFTTSHMNPHVQNTRRYYKRIYDTRKLIGVDLEFNVLIPLSEVPPDGLKIERDLSRFLLPPFVKAQTA